MLSFNSKNFILLFYFLGIDKQRSVRKAKWISQPINYVTLSNSIHVSPCFYLILWGFTESMDTSKECYSPVGKKRPIYKKQRTLCDRWLLIKVKWCGTRGVMSREKCCSVRVFFSFNWSIVNLSCCVSFKCTAQWFSYTYICIYIFFQIVSHYVITIYWI